MTKPKRIDLSQQELDALIERVEAGTLLDSDREIIKAMAETISLLSHAVDEDKPEAPEPKKIKGHGRNGSESYSGADKVKIEHEAIKAKDNCPKCLKGKVYEIKTPKTVVRITGKSPLHATVFEMQRLRCNLCGEVFTAEAPSHIGEEKYDAQSGAMIALLKYGSGLPFNRLEQLQASLGVPLPAANMRAKILKMCFPKEGPA